MVQDLRILAGRAPRLPRFMADPLKKRLEWLDATREERHR